MGYTALADETGSDPGGAGLTGPGVSEGFDPDRVEDLGDETATLAKGVEPGHSELEGDTRVSAENVPSAFVRHGRRLAGRHRNPANNHLATQS